MCTCNICICSILHLRNSPWAYLRDLLDTPWALKLALLQQRLCATAGFLLTGLRDTARAAMRDSPSWLAPHSLLGKVARQSLGSEVCLVAARAVRHCANSAAKIAQHCKCSHARQALESRAWMGPQSFLAVLARQFMGFPARFLVRRRVKPALTKNSCRAGSALSFFVS